MISKTIAFFVPLNCVSSFQEMMKNELSFEAKVKRLTKTRPSHLVLFTDVPFVYPNLIHKFSLL